MAGYVKKTTESTMARMTITFECTADAAAGTVPDQTLESSRGLYLMNVKTTPGAGGDAPDSTYAVTVYDDSSKGLVLLTQAARSASAKEDLDGATTLGRYHLMTGDEVFVTGDLGNSKKTTIVVELVPSWNIQ
jgi:hypothetical protein